jgi:hypothetical protein
MITPHILKSCSLFRGGYLCRSLSTKTVVKRQNDVKRKDGYGAATLKKSDLSCNSMELVLKPTHYFYVIKFIE